MKISIIVPVYNSSRLLEKCLDSLINQTYKDIEIIVVDDGSTDNSGEICDRYSGIDSRVVVLHKKNAGVCEARNDGIDLASGGYIGFVDADDYCKEEMFQYLASLAADTNADIACCGIERVYVHSKATYHTRKTGGISIFSSREAIEKFFLPDYITTAVWNKIFRANIVKNNRFKNYARNDDGWFVATMIINSERIAVCDECLYVYQIQQKSITRGEFSSKNYDILRSVDDIYNMVVKKYPDNRNIIVGKIFWNVVFLDEMIIAKKYDNKSINDIQKLIRNNIWTLIKYEDLSQFRKAQFYILAISFHAYAFLYVLYCRLWGKI